MWREFSRKDPFRRLIHQACIVVFSTTFSPNSSLPIKQLSRPRSLTKGARIAWRGSRKTCPSSDTSRTGKRRRSMDAYEVLRQRDQGPVHRYMASEYSSSHHWKRASVCSWLPPNLLLFINKHGGSDLVRGDEGWRRDAGLIPSQWGQNLRNILRLAVFVQVGWVVKWTDFADAGLCVDVQRQRGGFIN